MSILLPSIKISSNYGQNYFKQEMYLIDGHRGIWFIFLRTEINYY